MAELIFILYTIAHLVLFIWGIRLWQNGRKITIFLILLPTLGLIYDNGVIALGRLVGEGDLLQTLNQGRFLLHVLITPLLIAAAIALAAYGGVNWAKKQWAHGLFGVLTLGMIGLGLTEFSHFVYAPERFGNTLRYVDTAVSGPPIPSIITIIVIMVVGIFLWRNRPWPWMFLGGLIMFVGSAIPASLVGPIVGSGAEVVLMASLLATQKFVQT